MLTVAAILPQVWEFRLVDRNIRFETEADWAWADFVIISGMIVQKLDMLHLIREAKQRGKRGSGWSLRHICSSRRRKQG